MGGESFIIMTPGAGPCVADKAAYTLETYKRGIIGGWQTIPFPDDGLWSRGKYRIRPRAAVAAIPATPKKHDPSYAERGGKAILHCDLIFPVKELLRHIDDAVANMEIDLPGLSDEQFAAHKADVEAEDKRRDDDLGEWLELLAKVYDAGGLSGVAVSVRKDGGDAGDKAAARILRDHTRRAVDEALAKARKAGDIAMGDQV